MYLLLALGLTFTFICTVVVLSACIVSSRVSEREAAYEVARRDHVAGENGASYSRQPERGTQRKVVDSERPQSHQTVAA